MGRVSRLLAKSWVHRKGGYHHEHGHEVWHEGAHYELHAHPHRPMVHKGPGGGGGTKGQETGPFGPIFRQFHHDPEGAIAKLTEEKSGEAIAALHHPEVGDIDLVWGDEGTAQKRYLDGFGLAKIITKHPEVLHSLQEVLLEMKVNPSRSTENRLNLESATHRSAIRLDWEGQKKKWLLTAFEVEK